MRVSGCVLECVLGCVGVSVLVRVCGGVVACVLCACLDCVVCLFVLGCGSGVWRLSCRPYEVCVSSRVCARASMWLCSGVFGLRVRSALM